MLQEMIDSLYDYEERLVKLGYTVKYSKADRFETSKTKLESQKEIKIGEEHTINLAEDMLDVLFAYENKIIQAGVPENDVGDAGPRLEQVWNDLCDESPDVVKSLPNSQTYDNFTPKPLEEEDNNRKHSALKKVMSVASALTTSITSQLSLRDFLREPIPEELGMVKCRLQRGQKRRFSLVLEKGARLLMVAKQFGTERDHHLRVYSVSDYKAYRGKMTKENRDASYVGKIRGNYHQTEYVCYDEGLDARKAGSIQEIRKEMCAVSFQMQKDEPRSCVVLLPKIKINSNQGTVHYETFRPVNKKAEGSLFDTFANSDVSRLSILTNRQPVWNEKHQMYTLDFKGRAKIQSIKNALLESVEDKRHIFTFGKMDNDSFSVDLSYPLSLYQAFCIALTLVKGTTNATT